ncbi:hypothetical protein KIMH_08150 [Bombiscardovia apis]|uniref:Uncharacterized protein n=1 Tax=Bombiscardovia apis TaxID=2932182 RepID=A0ABN6SFB1_9BIFI|nr:hypothetical protein [Bombiscardovia apis]BDR54704.1 hypothetical protein KIMH_08150 [Bombiscardovia apis]
MPFSVGGGDSTTHHKKRRTITVFALNFVLRFTVFDCGLIFWGSDKSFEQLWSVSNWGPALFVAVIGLLSDWFIARNGSVNSTWERRQVKKGLSWKPKKIHHRSDFPNKG